MNTNQLIITGNLVNAPELKYTEDGTPVASACIANNESYTTERGQEKQITTFIDLSVWGKSAGTFSQLTKKGTHIFVEGQLRRNDWEKDGQRYSKHFIRVSRWQFTQFPEKTEKAAIKTANNE